MYIAWEDYNREVREWLIGKAYDYKLSMMPDKSKKKLMEWIINFCEMESRARDSIEVAPDAAAPATG